MAYKLKTAPASEPITLDEAKAHLRVSGSDEDSLISNLISAAREEAEKYMNRSIIAQTWQFYCDFFTQLIRLSYGDVNSITSIKYFDDTNAEQTLPVNLYDSDLISNPARITRAYGASYPSTYERTNAVIIEYIAGFATVPGSVKAAILLTIGHLYENREDVVVGHTSTELPKAASYLLEPYRIFTYE